MSAIAAQSLDVTSVMNALGKRAKAAAQILSTAPTEQKNLALTEAAAALVAAQADIIAANEKDVEAGRAKGMSPAFVDRLMLDANRIEAIAQGLRDIAELDDPIGAVMARIDRPNGLKIERVRTPLGVIGVIFESRPNVTADAGALCLKSGNAVILRGGSDSNHSSNAVHAALQAGLEKAGLPIDAIQLVPTTDRAAVGLLLKGLQGSVDVIIPRGGKGLVARVQDEARVPVFSHLEGICHIYVDQSADLKMAEKIIVNAKMRRTGICGAAETLLIAEGIADSAVPALCGALCAKGCAIRGDEDVLRRFAGATSATDEDWTTEYLDAIISVKIVPDVHTAVKHVQIHSSGHTECIIAEDAAAVDTFFAQVDSAIVMHNASTQFADGGEFGMGAEIGIATGKMHARGPVGVEQLTSFKYLVHGTGQTRP